jgi:hypothetical protein
MKKTTFIPPEESKKPYYTLVGHQIKIDDTWMTK